MRKIAPYIVLFLLALLAWEAMVGPAAMSFVLHGGAFDGPFDTLVSLLLAGAGLVIGVVALLFAALAVAVVCAGLGLMAVIGLVPGAVIVAAVVAPFLLPLLIPVAIIWYLLSRDRKNRVKHQAA